MAGSLENRGKLRELIDKFQFKGVDPKNWNTLKLENDNGKIIGAVRYRQSDGFIDVGRLMIHPDYRHRGLAQILLSEVDHLCPKEIKELYTCTKSWSNIQLYEKMGYKPYKKNTDVSGLSFVHMRK